MHKVVHNYEPKETPNGYGYRPLLAGSQGAVGAKNHKLTPEGALAGG